MEKSNEPECEFESPKMSARRATDGLRPVKKQKIDYVDKAPTSDDIEFLRRLPLTEEQLMKLIQQIPNRSTVTNEN